MLSSAYTPNIQAEEEDDMLFRDMSEALQDMITPEVEELFDSSTSDACLPTAARKGVKARDILKQHVESSFELADRHGQEGIKQLETMHLQFRSWCNAREAQEKHVVDASSTESRNTKVTKRKFVPMTDCKYSSSQKRHFNTHHMRR